MSSGSENDQIVKLSGIRSACGDCSLYQLCLPVSLSTNDVERLEQIVQKRRPLSRGDHLYRAGDDFRSIYAIKSGSMKTYTISEDGEEQVTGFHLPGEMVGLDAINSGSHPCSAVALETSSICEIPFAALEELACQVPGLQRQLLRIMSKEIFADHEMLQALAKRTAEERLAIVLLSLSDRFSRRGLSPYRFRLTMSRSDLSNYLGLAPETMSRLFKRFHDKGWMNGEGKEIELVNVAALRLLAGRKGEESVGVGRHGHG